jgi:hypothetical protein
MAITPNPQRTTTPAADKKADDFISGGATKAAAAPKTQKQARIPIQVKFEPTLLKKATEAAPTLGLDRTAFIVLAVAEKLQQMGR